MMQLSWVVGVLPVVELERNKGAIAACQAFTTLNFMPGKAKEHQYALKMLGKLQE